MHESLCVWTIEFLIVSLCLNMHEWLTCVGRLIVTCMSYWLGRFDLVSKDEREMLTNCFMRCEIIFVLGEELWSYLKSMYNNFCLTWESVVWRGMFCRLVFGRWFVHQDVRIHGDVQRMLNLFLWRRKRKMLSSYVSCIMCFS